jgi:SPP1 gp7 family putative phage head morphogenesis protein
VSRQLVNIADRYDAELDKASQDVLKRIAAAYDVSYRAMVAKLRDAMPRLQQAGSISTLVRQGAIAAEMGEALKFLNPSNEQAIEQLGYDVIQQAVDLGQQMAGDSLNYIGLQAPFTTIPIGAVRNQAERFRERLVNYSNQQASQISAVVEQGLIQGWGTRKIEGQLKTLGVSFKSNAETIARTETMSAYNGAAKSRYEQAGVAYVQWIATPAEGTCSLCYARNTKAWKTTEAPAIPAHPRCRCTYLPTASLSDIDTAFYEDYSKQGLDDLERQGLQPDNGPTYWEKKAGITPAKPSWVPGQAVPVAPVVAKPALKFEVPERIGSNNVKLYETAAGRSPELSKQEILKAREFMPNDGYTKDKIKRIRSESASITADEARAIASYIHSDSYGDMARRVYGPSDQLGPVRGTNAGVDATNVLAAQGLRKLAAVTEDSINDKALAFAERTGKDPALYDNERGLTRLMTLDNATADKIFSRYQKALNGDELLEEDTWFATSTLSQDKIRVAGGVSANFVYKIRPRLDGAGQGRYVDHFKNEMIEGEVLYPPYSRFRVKSVRKVDGLEPTVEQQRMRENSLNLRRVSAMQALHGSKWKSAWKKEIGGEAPSASEMKKWEADRDALRGIRFRPNQYEIELEEV